MVKCLMTSLDSNRARRLCRGGATWNSRPPDSCRQFFSCNTRVTELLSSFLFILIAIFSASGHVVSAARTTTASSLSSPSMHLSNSDFSFRFTASSYNVSIVENSVPKTFLTSSVSKMGIQVPIEVPVTYVVVDGNSPQLFTVSSKHVGDFSFLRIRTVSRSQAVINREQQDLYRLTIEASPIQRGVLNMTARTEVVVHVIDDNDLSPLFDPTSYTVDIEETAPVHHTVVKVTASDADVGINGEILYSFSTGTETFSIHPTSGVITLARPLKPYSEVEQYQLTVIARDRGPSVQERSSAGGSARVSKATVIVKVIEVNQYAPSIELQELPAVVEHGKVGTIYAILSVTDLDRGRNGQIASVDITDGNVDGFFSLDRSNPDRSEYRINVARTLDRESFPDGFNLTLVATDMGSPARNSSKMVRVRLQDTNDHAPVFSASFYNVSIDECLPMYTPVVRVSATDLDQGRNAETVYSIEDGGIRSPFSVNPSTGLVSVAGTLDAETTSVVNLVLLAHDRANKGSRKVSRANVQVNIIDCNDNAPVFAAVPTVVYVDENQPAQSSVYKVQAMDADHGDHGFISYSLANVDVADLPFSIDHFTGVIHTKTVIDYETMRRVFTLVVRASDWGTPFRRETETLLRIKVRDVNDNNPQFERLDCVGSLARDAPINTELLVASALDLDSSDVIVYRLVTGNDDACFELDPATGRLRTRCNFRSERSDNRELVISATDGTNIAAQPMTVKISFVHSNSRGSSTTRNAADVSNFSCRNTAVATQFNDAMLLAEQSNPVNVAETTTAPNLYSTNLYVPKFDTIPRVVIREDAHLGQRICSVNATDLDHGYNGRLTYVISGGNVGDTFAIDSYTGVVSIVAPVDAENTDSYLLNITVSDMGSPMKQTYMILTIIVDDVNDNAPRFLRTPYVVSVSENVAVNKTIFEVAAVDDDRGENGRVMYRLANEEGGKSSIYVQAQTGHIMVRSRLDREKQDRYELVIIATDCSKDMPLATTATVTVLVKDVNDNSPLFSGVENDVGYHVRVPEDMPAGMVITTVYAHDPDSGVNGQVHYSFGDDAEDMFTVDHMSGAVRLSRDVSATGRRYRRVYNVTLVARDAGEPNLQTSARLVVEIVNVRGRNVYAPTFKEVVFTGHVKENQPAHTSVMQVTATDRDAERSDVASPEDYEVMYSIRDGSGLGRFTIDGNGKIYTREPLDRESQSFYWLTVYAHDSGTVPLSSMTEVYIEVGDVNDNVPQTREPVYYPTVLEGSPERTPVIQLQGYDFDTTASSLITYNISAGNQKGLFQIDHFLGLISTTGVLDRESETEHILEVTVRDNGEPQLSSATLVVISVADINDNAPVFVVSQPRVRIPRLSASSASLNISTGLYRVVAKDMDVGLNAALEYSIVGAESSSSSGSGGREGKTATGKIASIFRIDPTSGMIYALREFDKKETRFDFNVKVTDRGVPPLSSTMRVIFDIPDPNHFPSSPPSFTNIGVHDQVLESDNIGTLVVILAASYPDKNSLSYFITGGNVNDAFSINTPDGNINVARHLDWETHQAYNLTVMVTDGIYQAYSWLHITVKDINDNAPQFVQSTFTVDVSENVAPGTAILVVTATDLDEDRRLFYTLTSAIGGPSSLAKFKIDSETGVLTTTEELNRESVSRHVLTVMVRDQATRPKKALARIIINVLDHNDHTPEFLVAQLDGRVYTTAPIGTSVVQVIAVDKDKGLNAEISYHIVSGNQGDYFSIDPMLGIISVAKSLDSMSESAEYNLTVRAMDAGSPSLSSFTVVHIQLTMSNDVPPKFDQLEYLVEVMEDRPIGSFIVLVKATCRSSLIYRIVSGNEDGLFNVDPSSGAVFTVSGFDYEIKTDYNLMIRATSIAGAIADTSVSIHILDANDNRPAFLRLEYNGTVSEAATPGSHVLENGVPLVLHASDADSHENSQLMYWMVFKGRGSAEATDVFEVDANTGAIRTRVMLDRELVAVYEFDVQVTDLGQPISLSAPVAAHVTIHIDDVNDSPPVFDRPVVKTTLLLPTQADVTLVQLVATDNDTPQNGQAKLRYSIVDDHPSSHHFHVDALTGKLAVSGIYDMLDQYKLKVKVTDGKYESQCTIEISVDLLKTAGLVFSQDVYYAEIIENSTNARELVVTQTVGHSLNEHLTFSLLNPRELFAIRPTSGTLYTREQPFDRETRDQYVLVVEVRDERSPQRIAHALINVTVTDVNDNAPIFINQPFYAVVGVEEPVGKVIKKLTAIDRDIDYNGIVEYFLVDGDNSSFDVQRDTGEIIVGPGLTHLEQNVPHKLVIEAKDKGQTPLSSRVEVFVTVMDKATPIFDHPFYRVTASENLPIYSTVIAVQAVSPTAGKLIYSIISGDPHGEFAVDFNTDMDMMSPCAIIVLESLDYETSRSHELVIRATDIHSRLYSNAIVRILVEDVNDHDPVLDSHHYAITLSEALPIGATVLTVNATDADAGLNARLNYRIEPTPGSPANDASFFHIDSAHGIVTTKQRLDHEQTTMLSFIVVVSDTGTPARTTSATVSITVTDLNDNAPRFDQPSYESSITEKSLRGQFVVVVHAYDEDSLDRGRLMYSLVNNEKQTFTINASTGVIALSSIRRPELLIGGYRLNVSVTDGVFTTFSRVVVNVVASNKYPPRFSSAIYDVSLSCDVPIGSSVLIVTATDDDGKVNDGRSTEITYRISDMEDSKVPFKIDSKTGLITTAAALDARSSVFVLNVYATDAGGREAQAVVRISVTDDGNRAPVFFLKDYKASVYSSQRVGSQVLPVIAMDERLGSNVDISYSLVSDGVGANSSQFFDISQTGLVTIKSSLAASENQLLQFFVRAEKHGNDRTAMLHTDVPVEIYVMSSADQAPAFRSESYTVSVSEDTPLGSVVAILTVVNSSVDSNSVTYSIVAGHQPKTNWPTKFAIDPVDGSIRVVSGFEGQISGKDKEGMLKGLDRETTETFDFKVRAETKASPPLVAHTHVTIRVMDVNDNRPVFEKPEYSTSVTENMAASTQVLHVKATDLDLGNNGSVTYHLFTEQDAVSTKFRIDPLTGWITTAAVFDREDQALYRLKVKATDAGSPQMLSSVVLVIVTVVDENDNAPVFDSDRHSGAVNEDALPGTIILHLITTDQDEYPNNVATYYISEGDAIGQFAVRGNGEVYVNRELDREQKDSYDLTVIASDGVFVTTTRVVVVILDANDNAPVCEQMSYETDVLENVAIGHVLPRLKISATDADEPGTRNSRVEYLLERGDPNSAMEAFNVHKKTGSISTKIALDREAVSSYHLKVVAVDGGGLSCTIDVDISVGDVNDNPPQFLQSHYVVTVPENTETMMLIARVTAIDLDLGINRKITYSLVGSDMEAGIFVINSVSGVVSLTQSLDREIQDSYNLTIYATDQGSPRLSSSTLLTVVLIDVNDNAPEFERTVYNLSVSETESAGFNIGHVYAVSRDTGINAEMTYSILPPTTGQTVSHFAINAMTGVLSLLERVDYEIVKEYVLTVQATDGGTPPLSSTTVVIVTVLDANDNSPVFTKDAYQAVVPEDTAIYTSILQVEATDADSGPGGELEFKLISTDHSSLFRIDSTTGDVIIACLLDREKTSTHVLTIAVVDKGLPPLTSTVVLMVNITDVNDSPPRIRNSNLTAAIQPDDEPGSILLALHVTDDDLEPNGAPFLFEIIASNPTTGSTLFYVDPSGAIMSGASSQFDRTVTSIYELTVRVSDSGTPPMYTDIIVNVTIIEESRSPPEVTPLTIAVVAIDNIFQGGVIGRVKAVDNDPFDQLTFDLVCTPEICGGLAHSSDALFAIDPRDGTLTALQSLDTGEYVLNISVSDGRHTKYADVRLNIEGISAGAADNAVVIRFENVLPEEFMAQYLRRLLPTLKSELAVREKDIKILSIQPATDDVLSPADVPVKRGRRSVTSDPSPDLDYASDLDLDVLIAIQKSPKKYYASKALKRHIEQSSDTIQRQVGIRIVKVFNSVCATKDRCSADGDCNTVFSFRPDDSFAIISDTESFVSVPYDVGFKCLCKPGTSGPLCMDKSSTVCTPGLCKEPKICHSDGQSYTCSCPEGRGGEECRDIIEPPCNDYVCRKDKPMTFSGFSYAKWRLMVPMERRLSLSLEIKTVQRKTRITHAVGRVDYSILEIEDGMIQYRFDCGSGVGQARVDKMVINDGDWHTVVVERIRQNVKIIVDGKYIAEGSAPGTNDVLNLDSNDVFFGAEVETLAHGFEDIRQGFVGCMQKIKIDSVELPLAGSSSVAVLQHLQEIEFHCRGSYIPGVCSSSPCRNGGSCLPLSADQFVCTCRTRFSGTMCDIDTDPCASKPCLNNGVCENIQSDFKCTCPGRGTKSKRCELACDILSPTNGQCKNGGRCVITTSSPSCECLSGYQGEQCERDIDECRSSPCPTGATCLNTLGSFLCNYTGGSQQSELYTRYMEATPAVLSSTWGSRPEEILIIAGVCVGLLMIVVIFIFVGRYCRQRHIRRRQKLHKRDDDSCYGDEAVHLKRKTATTVLDTDMAVIDRSHLENGHNRHRSGVIIVGGAGGSDEGSMTSRNSTPPVRPLHGPSPKPPKIPKRPASYTPSGADSSSVANTLNNINCDAARDYGSAAEELEATGIRESIAIPAFLQQISGGVNLPLAGDGPPTPKRMLPPTPKSSSSSNTGVGVMSANSPAAAVRPVGTAADGAAPVPHSNGLNYLNKAENYYSKSPKHLSKIIPSVNGSNRSLQLLPNSGRADGSVVSLPISESEDDTQGFEWDTSDWNPAVNVPLLTRVHKNSFIGGGAGVLEDVEGYDSEYVEEEFTENEFGDDDDNPADMAVDFPPSLDFQKILAMRDELNYDTEDLNEDRNYNRHPNEYLPELNISQSSGLALAGIDGNRESGDDYEDDNSAAHLLDWRDDFPEERPVEGRGDDGSSPLNGNFSSSADFISRDDDDDVVHYGFPTPHRSPGNNAHSGPTFRHSRGHDTDTSDCGGINLLDKMSLSALSVGGYKSTNADDDSMASDIAGLCEIEPESEANVSEDDEVAVRSPQTKLLRSAAASSRDDTSV